MDTLAGELRSEQPDDFKDQKDMLKFVSEIFEIDQAHQANSHILPVLRQSAPVAFPVTGLHVQNVCIH